jgi:hypothetical protein
MNGMISYCGLYCDTCPIHLATLETDKEMQRNKRFEIAKLCREQYGMDYNPDDITDCDGCRTENGRLFSGCKTCEIRKCAIEKRVENCAYCDEYACEKLKAFLVKEPIAETRLNELRNKIQ